MTEDYRDDPPGAVRPRSLRPRMKADTGDAIIISVERKSIIANREHGTRLPTIRIQRGVRTVYADRVVIDGRCEFVQDDTKSPAVVARVVEGDVVATVRGLEIEI